VSIVVTVLKTLYCKLIYSEFAGQKFALFEMKVMIIFMLSAFHIRLTDENFKPMLVADIILKSENGILLKFKPR
jgi:hypothetical protein